MIVECRAFRKVFTPEEERVLRKVELDPNTPSGKEMMYYFLKSIGQDIEYGDVFNFV